MSPADAHSRCVLRLSTLLDDYDRAIATEQARTRRIALVVCVATATAIIAALFAHGASQ